MKGDNRPTRTIRFFQAAFESAPEKPVQSRSGVISGKPGSRRLLSEGTLFSIAWEPRVSRRPVEFAGFCVPHPLAIPGSMNLDYYSAWVILLISSILALAAVIASSSPCVYSLR